MAVTSGLPTGTDADHKDFVRCKACHGWDALGDNGGYVRRTANANRPEPIAGGDLSPFGEEVDADVWHAGGRDFSTMDNTMPDYSLPEGLTDQQVADVVAFLNNGPKAGDVATLDTNANPVDYTFTGANTGSGATLYGANCAACHGADGTLDQAVSLGVYFSSDGKYSEGFHKMIYGAGDAVMTRVAAGDLTADEARDILAYIQANLGTTFPTN